ncbi:MAG: efflux RND transporter periplasmic adaptor subunit [Bacteroidota bacterium]
MTLSIKTTLKNRVIAILTCCLMVLVSCKNNQTKETEEPLKKVKYTVIDYANGQKRKSFNGETQSSSTTNLSFRMGGIITTMNAKVGMKVKKGELLAQLDTREIDLSVQQINEAVRSSKIQMETAESTLERTKRLYQSEGASLSDLENARNNYAQASAAYESNLQSLNLQRSQYNYAKIVAPNTGIVSSVNAEQNEVVNAGGNIITIDSDDGNFQVKVSLPENYINEVELENEVVLIINNEEKKGAISEIGYAAKGASFPILIDIENGAENLRPGLSATVIFDIGSASQNNSLVVPIEAVRQDDTGNYVYQMVPLENGTYEVIKKTIKIGDITGDYFIIVSGLNQMDYIAIAGLNDLYEGMKVQLFKN